MSPQDGTMNLKELGFRISALTATLHRIRANNIKMILSAQEADPQEGVPSAGEHLIEVIREVQILRDQTNELLERFYENVDD